jgi:ribonucleoside-diphosphate reductase alpha chain
MATEVTRPNGGEESFAVPPSKSTPAQAGPEIRANAPGELRVIRRNGKVTGFDANKIAVAMTKAFLAVEGGNAAASGRVHNLVKELADQLTEALKRRNPAGGTVHIEDIQDQVELALMRSGEHKVARAYVLYREEQARKRAEEAAAQATEVSDSLVNVTLADGSTRPLDIQRLRRLVDEACAGLEAVTVESILDDT